MCDTRVYTSYFRLPEMKRNWRAKWVKVHEAHAIMLTTERDFVNRTIQYVQHVSSYVTSSEAVLALVSVITSRFTFGKNR